jgi:hypothetical protein
MARPGFADRHELLRWADSVGASSELPRLIRHLILETGSSVVHLGFPAGEGVRTGGWDGTVRTSEATPFIPRGLSLWELSVSKSPGTKADSDFEKRLDTPDGTPTSDSTYVAVSLRPWTKREEWASARAAQGRWQSVRALGVDDIETWLEDAPVTHAWLSDRLGLNPHGLEPAESWWRRWSMATTPNLPTELVLAGRSDAASDLRSRLAGRPRVTTIQGGSMEETLAFIAAAAHGDPTSGEGYMLPRVAFVDDVVAWRMLIARRTSLVLVPLKDELVQEIPVTRQHHFLVPLIGGPDSDIGLRPINHVDAAAALRAAGMTEEAADSGGRLARTSLLALRRHLANRHELHVPSWARAQVDRVVRGALLAGRWNDQHEGDQAVVTALTGVEYEDLREVLAGLTRQEDPLLTVVQGSRCLVGPSDAWLLLRGHIRPDDLDRFEAAVLAVLGERGAASEASLEGEGEDSTSHGHSGDIRRGLAASLALLGVHGGHIDGGNGTTGSERAAHLVRRLLDDANADRTCGRWASLNRVLSLLAEAAPDAFLNGVRAGLQGESPVLAGLFKDSDDRHVFAPSSPHTGLLWALECVAWSPGHFSQAIDLLASLAELDPGGSLSNRPANSLDRIYCPWHPENSVDMARRLEVFDVLRQRHPEIAWHLGLGTLPKTHDSHSATSAPRYRDWRPAEIPVPIKEYFAFVGEITPRLLEDADVSPERWSELLGCSTNLPPQDWSRVRSEVSRLVDHGELSDDTSVLWSALRTLIGRHRRFPNSEWALPSIELRELEVIERRLAPDDAVERHGWLFQDGLPDLGEPYRPGDHARYMETLAKRRQEAISEVDSSGGFDAVRKIALESAMPWAVGGALAEAVDGKYERELLALIGPEDSADVDLALGFMAKRFENEGWDWLESLLREPHLSDVQRARLLLGTGAYPKSWEVAGEHGKAVLTTYWKRFLPYGLGSGFAHVESAAKALVGVERYAAALKLLLLYRDRGDGNAVQRSELIVLSLEGLLRAGERNEPGHRDLSEYDFQSAIEYLESHKDEVGRERIATLEWAFLPVLGYKPKVDTLHQQLTTDPQFFVQVVSAVYRRASEEDDGSPSEEEAQLAANGYQLLSSLSMIPGWKDGRVDPAVLRKWVSEALELLGQADRGEIGEIYVGHVLASAPADADGIWPCVEIRDLLEELQIDNVDRGLRTEIYNRRGVTSRGLEDGGAQERDLVKKYREQSDALADRWPRTAAILRSLADGYEREARQYEEDAERYRRGLS